eukprot:14210013-Ditylum_brightwellii.AAC.1
MVPQVGMGMPLVCMLLSSRAAGWALLGTAASSLLPHMKRQVAVKPLSLHIVWMHCTDLPSVSGRGAELNAVRMVE